MNMKQTITVFLLSSLLLACGKEEGKPNASAKSSEKASAELQSATPSNTPKNQAPEVPVEAEEERVLNVYNWPDYIPDGMLDDFAKETGIKVNYDTFETSETLNAKLVAGKTGYDIVVTGTSFSPAQTEAGYFRELDKTTIINFSNLDPLIAAGLAKADPGNRYLVPWAWGFTTVGINKTKAEKALKGLPLPENAWDLVFNPEYTSKLKSCGIAYLDSPTEILPVALLYIGKDPYSENKEDIDQAKEMMLKVRKDIRLFSSTMIDDVAAGKACAVIGWSGDINMAAARAKENKSKDVIQSLLPTQGALMWFDTMAVLSDAKHPKNAMTFINWYLRPENAARISNEMSYNTGNKAALQLINPDISGNETIFVNDSYASKLVPPAKFTNQARDLMSSAYTSFKKGK